MQVNRVLVKGLLHIGTPLHILRVYPVEVVGLIGQKGKLIRQWFKFSGQVVELTECQTTAVNLIPKLVKCFGLLSETGNGVMKGAVQVIQFILGLGVE